MKRLEFLKYLSDKYLIVVFILTILSTSLMVVSFFVPPYGVIDSSVLIATGELFSFAALWTFIGALIKGMNAKIQKGDTSIEVRKDDDREC